MKRKEFFKSLLALAAIPIAPKIVRATKKFEEVKDLDKLPEEIKSPRLASNMNDHLLDMKKDWVDCGATIYMGNNSSVAEWFEADETYGTHYLRKK